MARDLFERVPAAHLLVGSLCAGLSLALLLREADKGLLLAASAAFAGGLAADRARTPLLALTIAIVGIWWGSARLDALDRSLLEAEIGRAGLARVEVIGPARRSEFALRVPVRVRAFRALAVDERASLELPPEPAPQQGAVLEFVATLAAPATPREEGDFDEAGYLGRQGIHVILRANSFRVVGRRGGLGGLGDRLREEVSSSLASGSSGEPRAVLAGIVLGEDEGLDAGLRDSFRASGLYHLLRKFNASSSVLVVVPSQSPHLDKPRESSPPGRQRAPNWKAPAPKVYAGKVVTDRRKTRAVSETPTRSRSSEGLVKGDEEHPAQTS